MSRVVDTINFSFNEDQKPAVLLNFLNVVTYDAADGTVMYNYQTLEIIVRHNSAVNVAIALDSGTITPVKLRELANLMEELERKIKVQSL